MILEKIVAFLILFGASLVALYLLAILASK
jgi:hypothetical protein